MLYQNWNRTPVYFELAVSDSYLFVSNATCLRLEHECFVISWCFTIWCFSCIKVSNITAGQICGLNHQSAVGPLDMISTVFWVQTFMYDCYCHMIFVVSSWVKWAETNTFDICFGFFSEILILQSKLVESWSLQ